MLLTAWGKKRQNWTLKRNSLAGCSDAGIIYILISVCLRCLTSSPVQPCQISLRTVDSVAGLGQANDFLPEAATITVNLLIKLLVCFSTEPFPSHSAWHWWMRCIGGFQLLSQELNQNVIFDFIATSYEQHNLIMAGGKEIKQSISPPLRYCYKSWFVPA